MRSALPTLGGERPLRIGGYLVVDELGAGGQGRVFRAIQPGTGREVALKRLGAGNLSTPVERRRFEREIELASKLFESVVTLAPVSKFAVMAHRGLGAFHMRNGDPLRGADHLALSAEQHPIQFGPRSTWPFEVRVEELSALVKADARERAIALLAVILDDLQVLVGVDQSPKEPFATALRDLARQLGQSAALEAVFPMAPK